jgi:hypothetical protein
MLKGSDTATEPLIQAQGQAQEAWSSSRHPYAQFSKQ